MSQNTFEEVCNKEFRKGMHSEIMCEFLRKKKNPTILEFGVNTGGSTKTFISLFQGIISYNIHIGDTMRFTMLHRRRRTPACQRSSPCAP